MTETALSDDTGEPTAVHALDARCRLLADGDRLVLLTDEAAVVLRGSTTPESIAAGLSLLDGTRTLQEVADRLGVPVDRWAQVVSRLADVGLVTPTSQPGDLLRPLVDGLVRTAGNFGRAPSEPSMRLHLLGANHPLVDALADVWLASGAPEPRRSLTVDDGCPQDALWVHAALTDDEFTRTNEAAIAADAAWLQVAPFDGELLTVGPVHVPGQTCCAECVRIRRAANAPYGDATRASRVLVSPRLHASPIIAGLHANLTALVAAMFAVRPDDCAVGLVHSLDLSTMSSGRHRVLRVPRCPSCSPAAERAIPYPWTRSADVAG